MSPALSDLPVRKVTGALESIGFEYVRTKGSHAFAHLHVGAGSGMRLRQVGGVDV